MSYSRVILLLSFFSIAIVGGAFGSVSDTTCTGQIPDDLKITNFISPNNDGKNDEFTVESDCLTELSVKIYNRWGLQVGGFTGINGSWDGTANGVRLESGTYFYVVEYQSICAPGVLLTVGGSFDMIVQ